MVCSKSQSCTRTLIYVFSEHGKNKTKLNNKIITAVRGEKKKIVSKWEINLHIALNMCSYLFIFLIFLTVDDD